MRRPNPYRMAIRNILRDEQRARPNCALVSSIGVDEDGRAYIHFSCLSHDNASWRYYVHVYLDTELATSSYSGSELSSRCPGRYPVGTVHRPTGSDLDAPAEGPDASVDSSGAERDVPLVEVSDEIS